MGPSLGDALAGVRHRLVSEAIQHRDFRVALEGLGSPSSQADRDLAAICHYELMKDACVHADYQAALEHAIAIEKLRPSDRGIAALNAERLRLLVNRPAMGTPAKVPDDFGPGIVRVPGFGDVPVLGRYEAWGHHGALTQAILLLKKAPVELDERAAAARPEVIRGLGLLLWAQIGRLKQAAQLDLIVPIPPSPERWVERMYHPPEAVGRVIAALSCIPLFGDVLAKTRPTQTLRDLSREERQAEIQGSMEVAKRRAHLVAQRHVLLIDDVVTWGTHFREAKRALSSAGAGLVSAAALAAARGTPQ